VPYAELRAFFIKCAILKVNLSDAWKSGDRLIESAISRLPNLALAVVIFAGALAVASAAKALVRRFAKRRQRRQSLGILLGQLAQTTIAIVGFLVALSVVAPSFHAVDLIKILGIGSVAIGFAFQNILQNFLAGILLLLHEPFRIGDLISVTAIEGRVEDIQTRATIITTAEGRRVVIPNATLFTNPVAVAGPAGEDFGKSKPAKQEPSQDAKAGQEPAPDQAAASEKAVSSGNNGR
jgi:small-conductance mechanosensitive channel